MANSKDEFKIPLVFVIYRIIDFFQYFTSTFIFKKYLLDKKKKYDLFKSIVTAINITWLIVVIILISFKINYRIANSLLIFRLWEIFIINIWLFLFRQGATGVTTDHKNENDIRLLILLIIQYLTIVLIYAVLYRGIYLSDISTFMTKGLGSLDSSTLPWIYFSFVTITTVGFGDISALSQKAMLTVITEIVFGMFFILIFLTNILSKIKFDWRQPNSKK